MNFAKEEKTREKNVRNLSRRKSDRVEVIDRFLRDRTVQWVIRDAEQLGEERTSRGACFGTRMHD